MDNLALAFEDEDETPDEQKDETNPLKQAREHIKSLEKQLKQVQKDNAELREFKTTVESEKRQGVLSEAFKAAGLNEKWVNLYLKATDGEANPEAIKAFAEENDLPVSEVEDTGPATSQGFAPMSEGGVPARRKRYSSVEIEELIRAGNAAEAEAAIREGRVDTVKSLEEAAAREKLDAA